MNLVAALAQVREPRDLATPPVDWFSLSPVLVLIGGALLLLAVAALSPRARTETRYLQFRILSVLAGLVLVALLVNELLDGAVISALRVAIVGGILFAGLTATNAIRPTPGYHAIVTVVIAGTALVLAFQVWDRVQETGPYSVLSESIGVDGFAVFFAVVICSSAILAALLADDYLRRERLGGAELYVLMLLSASGGLIMASANDLIVMFLGLEILSIAAYVMAALHLRRATSQEAAIKYFVLGAFSSAFFLYGIALTYGATGSTNLVDIARFLADNVLLENSLLLAGIGLLLVGFAFKVAAVPFHSWTPDVYQGSPSPVVAWMASGIKAAGFAGLLRVLFLAFSTQRLDWQPLVYGLAVVTLLVGSVLAVVQTDLKRMMAYSSISHAGFVLVGVQAASDRGVAGALFYLLAYAFMIVGTFGVITLVGRRGDSHHSLDDYRGLSTHRPVLALTFTVFLLAQAGVPLTSGFFAKFYVIGAAVEERSYPLAVIAMVSAVIAAFLYLRIIVSMYMAGAGDDGTAQQEGAPIRVPLGAGVSLGIALAFTLVVGFLPQNVEEFARDALPALVAVGP